jgi:hypothetical protein
VSEASPRALTPSDAISSQATNNPVLTDLLMSEARRLIFRLKLNQAMPMEGLNVYEVEVCRRLYWEFWAVEKCAMPVTARDVSTDRVFRTAALNGAAILLHELEGTPPLPMPVDDDYISAQGHFPQPTGKRSYMSGFIAVTRVFRILGECLCRHRAVSNGVGGTPLDTPNKLQWIKEAVSEIQQVLDGVPAPTGGTSGLSPQIENNVEAWWGIQRANIHITALCAEFALVSRSAARRPVFVHALTTHSSTTRPPWHPRMTCGKSGT